LYPYGVSPLLLAEHPFLLSTVFLMGFCLPVQYFFGLEDSFQGPLPPLSADTDPPPVAESFWEPFEAPPFTWSALLIFLPCTDYHNFFFFLSDNHGFNLVLPRSPPSVKYPIQTSMLRARFPNHVACSNPFSHVRAARTAPLSGLCRNSFPLHVVFLILVLKVTLPTSSSFCPSGCWLPVSFSSPL